MICLTIVLLLLEKEEALCKKTLPIAKDSP
jgi:hypothetical protein